MAVFRVERNKGYTVMSNHHLRNKELSLKAKGLLSQMLSLPEDWDYTLAGLSFINREKIDAIREAVKELERAGYIVRSRERDEKGRLRGTDYVIFEQPQTPPVSDLPTLENPTLDNPTLEKPTQEKPTLENQTQLNKDIQKTDLQKKEKINTDLSSTDSIPIHSLNPLPYDGEAATPPERKRKEATDAYSVYEEIIKDNIEYDHFVRYGQVDKDRLDEIVSIILETVCSKRKAIRIAGDDYPAELVKAKFMKLNSSHIEFVFDCILTLAGARLLFTTAAPHSFEMVTAVFSCAGADFTARGKTVLAGGWKDLERRYRATLKDKPEADDEDNADGTLPELAEGQSFSNPAAKVTEHDTTPPKPHNEASLLSAMERAGNEDTDPDAERKGLGTPATRAAVIEKLVSSGFVERKGKQLIPTKDGNNLVCILPDNLTSPKLTAEWENNLTQIAKGAADPDEFLSGIEAMARELVKSYPFLSDNDKERFKTEKPEIGKCPRCGSPVHEGKKNYYCSNRDCSFVMWKNDRFFEERKVTFSPKIAAALLKSGKVKVKGLYSPKTGKTYDGTVVLADTGGKYVNYKIELPKKK